MKIIVGLGNPGQKYKNNRHNVGHMFVDYLNNQSNKSELVDIKIFKTDCFMNMSGSFVKKLFVNWKLKVENLIVAHDDLDIPLGKFHIQVGVGPQLHNGLDSIEESIKNKDFIRIRIGVDARLPRSEDVNRINGETYVLQDFTAEEKNLLEKDVFPKIFAQLKISNS